MKRKAERFQGELIGQEKLIARPVTRVMTRKTEKVEFYLHQGNILSFQADGEGTARRTFGKISQAETSIVTFDMTDTMSVANPALVG